MSRDESHSKLQVLQSQWVRTLCILISVFTLCFLSLFPIAASKVPYQAKDQQMIIQMHALEQALLNALPMVVVIQIVAVFVTVVRIEQQKVIHNNDKRARLWAFALLFHAPFVIVYYPVFEKWLAESDSE